jgi:hypothetical protein
LPRRPDARRRRLYRSARQAPLRAGRWNPTTTVTGNYTEAAINLVSGMLLLAGTPAAFTMTTPTAAQIVAALNNPTFGALWDWMLINTTAVAATIAAGAGVSLGGNLGNFVVLAGTTRLFKIHISDPALGAEAIQIYG